MSHAGGYSAASHLRWQECLPWVMGVAAFFLLPEYLSLGARILVFILFALSLDLILGYAGIITLGHSAFFGVGAYVAGILGAKLGIGDPLLQLAAAAVAAGECMASLGSDTGGSIRQPAAFCGVVGLKPTYGRVSRHGVIAYASSFDQVGPFARSLDDLALITEVISGVDAFDTTCSERAVPAMAPVPAERPFTFGYYKEVLDNPALDAEIRQYFFDRVDQLTSAGHRVEALDFPYLDALVPIYYILTTAEASSNLARYDGVHIGHRSEQATDLESLYKKSRSEGFGEEVQRRILLGTFVLSAGYFDAFYGKAQKARRVVRDATLEALTRVDALIGPTTPHTAFPLGQEYTDPTVLYLEDIFTVQAPIAGIPAVSIPAGPHSNGLPFGMQIMAGPFDEPKMFQAAHILDRL